MGKARDSKVRELAVYCGVVDNPLLRRQRFINDILVNIKSKREMRGTALMLELLRKGQIDADIREDEVVTERAEDADRFPGLDVALASGAVTRR